MEEQYHIQPMLYIPVGNPGAGKTFFARQYSIEKGIPLIDTSRIRRELFENPEFTNDENKVVLAMADYMCEQFLKSGQSVIFDGSNGSRVRRRLLRDMAKKYHTLPLVVWVQTDKQTSEDRATNRDRRNLDDKYARLLDKDTFKELIAKIMLPKHEEYVVISGKHVFKNQLHSVERKLEIINQVKTKSGRVVTDSTNSRIDINRSRNFRR